MRDCSDGDVVGADVLTGVALLDKALPPARVLADATALLAAQGAHSEDEHEPGPPQAPVVLSRRLLREYTAGVPTTIRAVVAIVGDDATLRELYKERGFLIMDYDAECSVIRHEISDTP